MPVMMSAGVAEAPATSKRHIALGSGVLPYKVNDELFVLLLPVSIYQKWIDCHPLLYMVSYYPTHTVAHDLECTACISRTSSPFAAIPGSRMQLCPIYIRC